MLPFFYQPLDHAVGTVVDLLVQNRYTPPKHDHSQSEWRQNHTTHDATASGDATLAILSFERIIASI